MRVWTKQGVWIAEVNDYFLYFCEALNEVWERWGNDPVITSAADGKHMEGSKHYKNEAWDLRVWGLRDPHTMSIELSRRLNQDGEKWLVLYGDKWHKEHMHVQTLG